MAFPPDVEITPRPWLSRPRSELVAYGVPQVPRIIQVHSTRSGVRWANWPAQSFEFQATRNWVQAENNKQVSGYGQAWGGCAHAVISEQGQLGKFWDKLTRYTTYAAGYGEYGWPPGWACDWLAVSYELCQPLGDMPFTDACLERAAIEMAKDCVAFGIEPVRIPYLCQQEPMNAVSGLVGHEDTANGIRVGKSDPGPMFPWGEFIAEVRRRMEGEEEIMAAQRIFVGVEGRPEVYERTASGLVHLTSPDLFVALGGEWPMVKKYPFGDPIWDLPVLFPEGLHSRMKTA